MAETETVDAPVAPDVAPGPAISTPTWRDSLPEPLRAEKSLQDFKDVGDLAKSYVATKALVGSKAAVPGPDAPPEAHAAFRKALGVPDTPDGYQIKRPEIALTGAWDQGAEKDFLGAAHKLGLPPTAVQGILNWYGAYEATKLQSAQRQANETMAALRQEWGMNYDAHLGRANRAVQQFGGDELISYLAQTGLGRHPAMVKAWVAVANAMVESGAMETEGDLGTSAEDAKAQLQAIYSDKNHAYNKPGSQGWQEAADEVLALRRIALGGDNRKLIEYR